ncbi:CNNM domain-containing protein [Halorubrum sp. HHNYT27]|uniref:CNNM domain-containing protein n=1 Tax=Halorubrum sp. HHNYT27 TaxID=3402275 RepID=UPI003EBFF2DE
MDEVTLGLVGIATVTLLLALSAFFSSSETAIFSLSKEWFEQLAASNDPRAGVLKELHDDPHRLLVTLLVGNNVVNIAISSIVTVLVASYLPSGAAVVVTTVCTSFLVLVFGEIVPKAFGLGNAETWSLRVASPVRLVERILSPLITLFDGITRRMNAYISGDSNIEKSYTD